MEKILIDTCIFIDIFRGNRDIFDFIYTIDCIINPIIYMELIQGNKNRFEIEKIDNYLKKFEIDYLDNRILGSSMELIREYSGSYGLKIPDAIIAANCIIKGYKIFTFNQKDFNYIPGIRLLEST
jgi:predicted nucleic acid-binding protein